MADDIVDWLRLIERKGYGPVGTARVCAEAADLIARQREEIGRLREALVDATAHLAGAASAYRTYARRHISQGKAVADPLFSTRANDFDKAVVRARSALSDTREKE